VRELIGMPLDRAYVRQEELGSPLRASEDASEGARAYLDRRAPVWKGR
jgi:enoyl-CoA hydratase